MSKICNEEMIRQVEKNLKKRIIYYCAMWSAIFTTLCATIASTIIGVNYVANTEIVGVPIKILGTFIYKLIL